MSYSVRAVTLRRLLPIVVSSLVLGCLSTDPIGDGDGGESGDGGRSPAGGDAAVGGAGGDGPGCGDDICSIDESCETCPVDCPCDTGCGDDRCDPGEDCATCEHDCGPCADCGDGVCDAGEDCKSCFEDCGLCPCVADAFEPNQSSGAATPISKGVDYCDLSICGADVDWFAFDVNGTTTVTAAFLHAQGDLELEIYSSLTAQYVTGSYSTSDDESVTLTGLPNGLYWARVYGDIMTMAENPDYCIRVD